MSRVLSRKASHLPIVALGDTVDPALRHYVLTVPGQEAPLFRLDLPDGVTGSARHRVAARQIADRIGDAAQGLELHPLAASDKRKTPWGAVVAPSYETLNAWRAHAAATDPRCRAVLPDYLTLAAVADTIVMSADGATFRARLGLEDGFSTPLAAAGTVLDAALREDAERRPTVAIVPDDAPQACRDVLNRHNIEIIPAGSAAAAALLKDAQIAPSDKPPIDLRQPPAKDQSGSLLDARLMVASLCIAGLAFGVWCWSIAMETRSLDDNTQRLRGETTAILRNGLIPDGPILDIRQQVALKLSELRGPDPGDAGPVALLFRATEVLEGHDVTITQLQLSADQALSLSLMAKDFETVDQLENALRNVDLSVARDVARVSDTSGVEARIRVQQE